MEASVYEPLSVIWNYMRLSPPLQKADCIVGFGNFNDDIPRRAAELYHLGYAPKVLFTGGLGRNTLGLLTEREAEKFAAIAIAEGVPESDVMLEKESANTAENILFTRRRLEEAGICPTRLIGVHQPFMERRIWAAFQVYWPEVELLVTSPQVDIETYLLHAVAQGISRRAAIEVIVGDFQRMKVYAEKGWQIPQEIPREAWDAYAQLTALGYVGQLA